MRKLWAFLILYLGVGMVTWCHVVANYDCGALDRDMCRSFAGGEAYFSALLWPSYWGFELLHPSK